jgi:hypothetical protein
VLKPAQACPLTALKWAELVARASFPPGVVNIGGAFTPLDNPKTGRGDTLATTAKKLNLPVFNVKTWRVPNETVKAIPEVFKQCKSVAIDLNVPPNCNQFVPMQVIVSTTQVNKLSSALRKMEERLERCEMRKKMLNLFHFMRKFSRERKIYITYQVIWTDYPVTVRWVDHRLAKLIIQLGTGWIISFGKQLLAICSSTRYFLSDISNLFCTSLALLFCSSAIKFTIVSLTDSPTHEDLLAKGGGFKVRLC